MRFSSVVLAVAGLLVSVGCAGNRARGLERPADLGPEWIWGAEAIPTGDVKTSTLTIEKFMPAEMQPDSVYSYTVRVTNVSKGPLNDVVVTDQLPRSGYTLISAEPDAQNRSGTLRWDVGSMGPGQSYAVRVTGHIEPGAAPSSCASVTFAQPEQAKTAAPDKAAEAAAATAAANKAAADKAAAEKAATDKAAAEKAAAAKAASAPKLDLSMSMPADSCAAEPVVVKVLLRNTGKTKATEVRVVDQFPEGMTVNGKKYVAFAVGELAPGAGREFTVKMRASKTGKFRNSVTATAAGGLKADAAADTTIWKNSVTVTAKASADSFGLGKDGTLSFTVTNSGDRAAAECALRVVVSGADSIKSASDGGKITGTTVTWTFGELAKGASKTVTVNAVRAKAGMVDGLGTATAKCADPVIGSAKANFK